jgi:hypothetical protein
MACNYSGTMNNVISSGTGFGNGLLTAEIHFAKLDSRVV